MFYEEKTPATIELIKTIGITLIVALVSYFISRLNVKIKKVEIQGQAELKARELIFNAKQKRLEEISDNAAALARWMSKNAKDLELIQDKQQKAKAAKNHLELCRQQIFIHYSYYEDLFEAIENSGLTNAKIKNRMNFVKGVLLTDTSKLKEDEYEEYTEKFLRAMSLVSSLESDIIEKERNDIFAKYLKKKKFLWLARN